MTELERFSLRILRVALYDAEYREQRARRTLEGQRTILQKKAQEFEQASKMARGYEDQVQLHRTSVVDLKKAITDLGG
jgi:predicted RNA-binding protein with PUA domain